MDKQDDVAFNGEHMQEPGREWWRRAVIYQVYPRSYQDSNGDGVGDLKGITQRLPYIASLGVDAVWISPFFRSPMKDFGYDVSDYRDVDPLFGSLADFDDLIKTADGLNMKILVDLVISHTSEQHEWFRQSRKSKDGEKSDWYVWADAKADGSAPNNWLSIFGGPAWQWDSRRCQYYLHNFLGSQPDLNFHNPQVQDAVLDIARFWLDRGVGGFRLDTINFYFCDEQLRDNPALNPQDQNSTIAPTVNPYNYQDHLYDKNQPENIEFLKRLRAVMNEYPGSMALGEVGDAQRGTRLIGQYTAGDDLMHMCYAFDFLSGQRLTPQKVVGVLEALEQAGADAWPCWAFSNHDVERHVSRWQLEPQEQRLMLTLMLSLRGAVCLYQGEELGLPEAQLAYEDIRDPYGIEFWPEFKGRDGCRTPMPWVSDAIHAGFSDVTPWLPLPTQHIALAVDRQQQQSDSLLNFYRQIIQMRKKFPALGFGHLSDAGYTGNVLHFCRHHDDERLLLAFNFAASEAELTLPPASWQSVLEIPASGGLREDGNVLKMTGWQAVVLQANR